MTKYIYKNKEANKFNKHGIDLTIFPTDMHSANVVGVKVEEGHFQEFKDKKSTYIYYIFEGKGSFVLNDEKYEVETGDLVVIPPLTKIHYFGKMKMSLTVTPAFEEENEIQVRLVDKNESPYKKDPQKYLLILHGLGGKASEYWEGWLANETKKSGYKIIMPTLPNSKNPDRSAWLSTIEKKLEEVKDVSSLSIVAHSLGVPAGLDYLETLDKSQSIDTFISVAGFYKPYGFEYNEEYMQAKDIQIEKSISKVKNRYVIRSLNDPYVTQSALKELGTDWEATEIVIREGEHFQQDEYLEKFELLEKLLSN